MFYAVVIALKSVNMSRGGYATDDVPRGARVILWSCHRNFGVSPRSLVEWTGEMISH